MGGGKGDSKTENTIRYAPYLEAIHQTFLADVGAAVGVAKVASPYAGYTDLDYEDAFYGAGYTISSFPSLYDMYGKFMAGLDIEILFDEHFEDTINGVVVNNAISQEAVRLDDELENNVLPRFREGMRDINSVMSSTFLVAEAQMEAERLKAIAKFSADLKVKLMPVVVDRWRTHLNWNSQVISMYANIMKLAITAKMDIDQHNLEIASKDVLWPFNAFQYWAQAIGAVSGATNTSSEATGGSKAARVIGSAMSGAASGAMIGAEMGSVGGPLGAAVGGLVGLAAGLF